MIYLSHTVTYIKLFYSINYNIMEQELFNIVKFGSPPHKAMEKITTIINNGVDPNTNIYCEHNRGYITGKNYPIMYVAVREGHIHVIKTLAENGAKFNYDEDISLLGYALRIWYVSYSSIVDRNYQRQTNIGHYNKYYKLWPIDSEERYYRIVAYLIQNNAKIFDNICPIMRQNYKMFYKKYYERKRKILIVKQMFVFVINEKTKTSVGNSILDMLEAENEFYLQFDSIQL